jgi:hypothetical protein
MRWGMGPVATEKKKMKEAGTLDVSFTCPCFAARLLTKAEIRSTK